MRSALFVENRSIECYSTRLLSNPLMNFISHYVVDESVSHSLADGLYRESDVSISKFSELSVCRTEASCEPTRVSSCKGRNIGSNFSTLISLIYLDLFVSFPESVSKLLEVRNDQVPIEDSSYENQIACKLEEFLVVYSLVVRLGF